MTELVPAPMTAAAASASSAAETANSAAETVLRMSGLGKRFGDLAALNDVNLEVRRGEVVVLLGLSGSGKSTLLRHVDGLEQPSAGEITVLGQQLSQLTGRELRHLRSRIGFVFQQFELVGSLTVLENVLTGALAALRGPRLGLFSYPRELKRAALGHLDRVGLLSAAYQRADTLSGGQQQRVAIARALMQNPEILLADEPVASLDPESSEQVMNLIREIAVDNGLTVLCSLHQVDLALGWGDRIVGLRHGEVVLDTPTEGLSKEQVMEIYGRVATTTREFRAISELELQFSGPDATATPTAGAAAAGTAAGGSVAPDAAGATPSADAGPAASAQSNASSTASSIRPDAS